LVIASAGGSGFTERQAPQKTVAEAVSTMLTLVGTGTTRGSTASTSSAACAQGAGTSGAASASAFDMLL
jgi:hypothetical protein